MKTNWQLLTFVRIVIVFILGVILASVMDVGYIVIIYCSLFLVFAFYLTFTNKSFKESGSLNILFFFLLLGSIRFSINDSRLYPGYVDWQVTPGYWVGTIAKYPVTKNRIRAEVDLKSYCIDDRCTEIWGKVLLYFPKSDSLASSMHPGAKLVFKGNIDTIKATRNPMAFDFTTYLEKQNIYHQVVLNEISDYKIISYKNLNPIDQVAQDVRAYLLSVFKKYIKDERKRSIASAMVLGYRNEMQEDIYARFSNSGAIHVLAVSGLHVGIIIGIVLFFTRNWYPKRNVAKFLKTLIPIGIAWFYVLLTGAAPAITRAAFMFSLWQIGRTWFRYYNSYNILAFSALIVLLFDPYLLFQPSFIFSYISLLSILLFQPFFSKIIKTNHRVVKYIADLISVSLSAQILVFPATIFIFHKFPVYFMLAGVLVVPGAILTLVLGVLLLLLHWIPFVDAIVTAMLDKVVGVVVFIVEAIDRLPYSVIDGIWINLPQVILLYLIIFGIWIYLKRGIYKGLLIFGVSVFLLIFSMGYRAVLQNRQLVVVIYDSYKGSVVDFVAGHGCWSLESEKLTEKDKAFTVDNYRNYLGVRKLFDLSLTDTNHNFIKTRGNVVQIRGVTFSLVTKTDLTYDPKSDYLVLMGNCESVPEEFEFLNENYTIITDSTIKKEVSDTWSEYCKSNNLNFLSTKDEAVIIKL